MFCYLFCYLFLVLCIYASIIRRQRKYPWLLVLDMGDACGRGCFYVPNCWTIKKESLHDTCLYMYHTNFLQRRIIIIFFLWALKVKRRKEKKFKIHNELVLSSCRLLVLLTIRLIEQATFENLGEKKKIIIIIIKRFTNSR